MDNLLLIPSYCCTTVLYDFETDIASYQTVFLVAIKKRHMERTKKWYPGDEVVPLINKTHIGSMGPYCFILFRGERGQEKKLTIA